ncbi:MAG: cation-transporting P-type ATPase [Methanoregulaceae archaeon]|nr:cation-transporting P-type ATPase [Methanoregulaceae archaeon]
MSIVNEEAVTDPGEPYPQEPQGLTGPEAADILAWAGPNEIFRPAPVNFFAIARHEITEPMILLLLFVGVVYAILGTAISDAVTIFVVIALLVFAEVWNEYRAKKAIAALGQIAAPKARVIRDGKALEIDAAGVVPGDVLILSQGTKIAGDGIVLRAVDLQADESALTGESFPLHKKEGELLYAGTIVKSGEGLSRVTVTGEKTRLGQIAASTREIRPPRTRLQLAMKDLAGTLVYISVGLVILITVVGILRGQDPGTMFLTGLSLAFATIPEELPIIITMVLGLGAYQLSRNNFLVKKLKAAETLGDTTVIVTDKTGTITEGKMQVVATFPDDQATILRTALPAVPGFSSSPLDEGVLNRGRELGIPEPASPILHKRDFGDGQRTRALVRSVEGRSALYITGAPEEVMAVCREIPPNTAAVLAAETGKGRRVIAVASRALSPGEEGAPVPTLEHDLSFGGLISFEDPPRPGVAETISRAAAAGIRTIVVTGDHPDTARFIASQVGIGTGSVRVVTGNEIDPLDDAELASLLNTVSIFARTTPEHKYRVVRVLQEKGEIVAVTGDGINDALALKGADIGIAMGVRGTDVARDAAEVILADDNYITIIRGIFEGRKFFENLRKGIVYYLSIKTALVLIFLIPVFAALPLPFSPIQIILLELFMDLGASAGFVAEPAEEGIVFRRPHHREEKVIDRPTVARILAKGTILFSAVIAVYFSALAAGFPLVLVQTSAIAAWIIGHIVLAYLSRSDARMIPETGVFSNPVINLWGLAALGTLLAGIYLPVLHAPLNMGMLPPEVLLLIAAAVTGWIVLAEGIRRWIFGKQYPEHRELQEIRIT